VLRFATMTNEIVVAYTFHRLSQRGFKDPVWSAKKKVRL